MPRCSLLPTIALVSIALAVTFAPAQSSGPRTADPAQKQFTSLLREPLPGHARAQAPPSFYNPDGLYQYIDGGADIYLLYNFKKLLHQDFKSGASRVDRGHLRDGHDR